MRHRATLALTLVLVAIGAAAVVPAVASAAHPVARGHYVDTDFALTADLRVAGDGRSFVPRRSTVSFDASSSCQLSVRLGRPGARTRIGTDGRFGLTRRQKGVRLSITGRFIRRNAAQLTIRYRRQPGASHACDKKGEDEILPRRIHRIPFHSCRAHKAPTVLATPSGRVFHQPRYDPRDGWTTVAFACSFRANRRVELGQDNDDDSDFGLFRLVGSYVAAQRADCPMGCSFRVLVRNLRTGATVHDVSAFDESFGRVTDLELKGNGSVAWIARGLTRFTAPPPFTPTPRSVWAADAGGVHRLAASNGIDPTSLALSGSALSWVDAGTTQTATLH